MEFLLFSLYSPTLAHSHSLSLSPPPSSSPFVSMRGRERKTPTDVVASPPPVRLKKLAKQDQELAVSKRKQQPEPKPRGASVRLTRKQRPPLTKHRFLAFLNSTYFNALLLLFLVYDVVTVGLMGSSTSFINYWDLIGTVAYIRSRNEEFAFQKDHGPLWISYLFFDSFFIYHVAGKTCRSIMRKTMVFPSEGLYKAFLFFAGSAFFPIHFCPKDALFSFVQMNDSNQFIICLYWSLTKVRSLNGIVLEAITVQGYTPAQTFALSMLSCEVGSLINKFDKNVFFLPAFGKRGWLQTMPEGFSNWVGGRSFLSSLFVSFFIISSQLEWSNNKNSLSFQIISYIFLFYRYSNGSLLDRVVDRILKKKRS